LILGRNDFGIAAYSVQMLMIFQGVFYSLDPSYCNLQITSRENPLLRAVHFKIVVIFLHMPAALVIGEKHNALELDALDRYGLEGVFRVLLAVLVYHERSPIRIQYKVFLLELQEHSLSPVQMTTEDRQRGEFVAIILQLLPLLFFLED